MKTALFTLNAELVERLTFHLVPLGFEIKHYDSPANIFEVLDEEFDLIVFDISHFARHWKPLVKLLRDDKSKEQTIVILMKARYFPFEEAAKAIFLGINGIIEYDENDKREIVRLTEIFKRYRSLNETRHFMRVVPEPHETFAVIFTNPKTHRIVTGTVVDISVQGMMFEPLEPAMIEGLVPGDMIKRCSMQIGDNIISLECKLTRQDATIGFEFTYFDDNAHHRLFTYLMERSARFLKTRVK